MLGPFCWAGANEGSTALLAPDLHVSDRQHRPDHRWLVLHVGRTANVSSEGRSGSPRSAGVPNEDRCSDPGALLGAEKAQHGSQRHGSGLTPALLA